MGLYKLPKAERLSGRSAVACIFESGESGFAYPFRYLFIAAPTDGEDPGAGISVLVTVSKKYHKRANRRNLIKRRTREAFRLNCNTLREAAQAKSKKVSIALIYTTKEVVEYKVVAHAVGKILGQVGERV